MPPLSTLDTRMYCRQCSYRLAGLSENRCPECGRPFNPADRRTYLRHPREWYMRRWLRSAVLLLLCVCLAIAGTLGWLYWGWRVEQPAIAALGKGNVVANNWGPRWLRELMPRRLWYLQVRVDGAQGLMNKRVTTEQEMKLLAALRHVRRVDMRSTTDAGAAHLRNLRELQHLGFWDTSITDEGLACVTDLKMLEGLQVIGPAAVTDRGLRHLQGLANLKHLELSRLDITDAGLANLASLQALETLRLHRMNLTDAGLRHLHSLPNLKSIYLRGTAVTPEGVRQLKQVLPGVQVIVE